MLRLVCVLFAISVFAASAAPKPASGKAALSAVPSWFEPNAGQFSPEVKFFSRHGAGLLLVDHDGARYSAGQSTLRLRLKGTRPGALIEGVDPTGARSSYFTSRLNWRRGVPHYGKVRASKVYPGIDVVYYQKGRELEFDFVVAPKADPSHIRMAFEEAGQPRLNRDGDLVFPNGLRQLAPAAYQLTDKGMTLVQASYRMEPEGEVALNIGKYDKTRPLIIDPVLFAGYLGGNSQERTNAVAIDAAGTVWIAGSSASLVTPPPGVIPIRDEPAGARDAFLAQLTPDPSGGLRLTYWTQLGGEGVDEATAVAVDNTGFVYITGFTNSLDFPRLGGFLQSDFGGDMDAFVAIIRPQDQGGDALWFSQNFGGLNREIATSIAVTAERNVYIAGYTDSTELPAGAASLQSGNRGGTEGFIAVINNNLESPLLYSTFFGGNRSDTIEAIAFDRDGALFVTGYTASDDFPVTFDAFLPSPQSVYLAKIDPRIPGLDGLLYATYIGGESLEAPHALAVDSSGNAWIAGYTLSSSFPVSPVSHRRERAGGADVFLLRFDYANRATPDAIGYSTYLGGQADDIPYGIALMPDGNVAVTGYTFSPDFPHVDSAPPTPRGRGADAFITIVNPAAEGDAAIVFSITRGGALEDVATGIAAGPNGRLYVTGYTLSSDLPVTDGSRKLSTGGASQSFVLEAAPRN